MGRSRKETITIPNRLYDGLVKLAPELGYANVKDLLVFAPLFFFQVPTLHLITGPVGQMDRDSQDRAIEGAVGAWERGEVTRSAFFEEFIAEVMRRLSVTATMEALRAVIADVWRTVREKRDAGGRNAKNPGMKTSLLLLLTAFLFFTAPARARIGMTIKEAIAEKGPPDKRSGGTDPKTQTYTWQSGSDSTSFTFKNGICISERHLNQNGLGVYSINKILEKAAKGDWNYDSNGRDLINGTLRASTTRGTTYGSEELTIEHDPKLVAELKQKEAEDSANAKIDNAVDKLIGQRDTERKKGIWRLAGKAVVFYPEGVLIQGEKLGDFPQRILLTGHPKKDGMVEGNVVTARVKIAGAFEYKGEGGATHRVHKLQYIDDIDLATLQIVK